MYKRSTYLVLVVVLALLFSCRKDKKVIPETPPTSFGTYVLFAADEEFNNGHVNAPSDYTSLYYAKLDGTGITAITPFEPNYYSYRGSWSFDGKKVIYTRGNKDDSDRGLCIIDVPGGNFKSVIKGHRADYGSFSPDGKQIAYGKAQVDSLYDYDVYIANANGTSEQRLTFFANDDGAVANIHWGADGKIYFNAIGDHHHIGIYSVDPDGNNLKSVISDVEFLGISRDAKHILCDVGEGLFTCDADGKNVKKIVAYDNNTPNTLLGASWSFDGKAIYLSYTDYPYGLFGIYRINSDGTGLKKVLDGFYEFPVVY